MKNKELKNAILNALDDDALSNVSGGADPNYYRSCTDFLCFYCGYQRTDSGEMSHVCLGRGYQTAHRCDNCKHLLRCDHGLAFKKKDDAIMGFGG